MNVMDLGSSCDADSARVQASSPSSLVYQGVKTEKSINEAPDWGLIIGQYPIVHILPSTYSMLKLIFSPKRMVGTDNREFITSGI